MIWLTPSFSSRETGSVFQSPSVPSKVPHSVSNSSNLFWSWRLRTIPNS
eukprot:CCRYP_007018-RA/>CCRYP_007018-RA protein AED:0.31 eAED:0.31 QI:71/1/0.5/1/0/0.5/2/0/48